MASDTPPTMTATATAAPTPTSTPPAPTATATVPGELPVGFPIDPGTRLGMVTGVVGSRVIAWGGGPAALEYSRDDQVADDPVRANRCGWNVRVHYEYEGQPAIDWYVRAVPVVATMDGTATLLINTVSNAFDVYGVAREPYIGNPDRVRAPVSPFPGPGGGQGVFVRTENRAYRTDHAHLELAATVEAIPRTAWLAGFAPDTAALARQFAPLRDFRVATAVAHWEVRRGDVIGVTGDSGYSEAPHLHYAIRPAGEENALCPTREAGFSRAGWLFAAPG